jgi:trimeric autotransporter adhesin
MKDRKATAIAAAFFTAMMLCACVETVSAYTEQNADPWGTFAGSSAGAMNTSSGNYNAFFGYYAGYHNNNGHNNAFAGASSGRENTSGSYNTFIGYEAGKANTTGSYNTFIGSAAGFSNETSDNNTYVGAFTGHESTGSGNVFIGYSAGYNETGSNKLYISNSDTAAPLIYGEFDNQILEINGRLVFSSDKRLKKNVSTLKSSLDKTLRLTGVTFAWKAGEERGKGRNIGFIAEDVEAVIPELVYTDRKGDKSLSYDRFAPVLTGAIQEQQAMLDKHKENLASESLLLEKRRKKLAEQDAIIKNITTQLADLRAEVNKLKSKDLTAQK